MLVDLDKLQADVRKNLSESLRVAAHNLRKLADCKQPSCVVDLQKLRGLLHAGNRKNAS